MNYIFSIASFCSFFFAVLLLKKKTKALHDRVLLYWLIYLGLFTGLYLISDFDFFIRFKLFPVFVISLFLLHGPFLFCCCWQPPFRGLYILYCALRKSKNIKATIQIIFQVSKTSTLIG